MAQAMTLVGLDVHARQTYAAILIRAGDGHETNPPGFTASVLIRVRAPAVPDPEVTM